MKTKSRAESFTSSHLFWIVIVSISTFIVYYPSLFGAFTNWDDLVYVKENPYIKSLSFENIKGMFSNNYMGNYHPLSMLSLAFDYLIFKLNPFGYHLTNLFLHILNSVLVLYLIRKLTKNIMVAAFAALIFGVHAFHVESVAWISERKDVLYTFFYLLSILAYLEYTVKAGTKELILSLFLFLLACLAKGQAVTLPLTLVLTDIFLGRKWTSYKVILEKVPFFVLAFIFGVVAIKAQAGADATIMANFPVQQRFAFASYGLVMYLLKLVIPFSLSAYYPYPIVSDVGEVPVLFWLAIIPALALIATWILTFKRSKPLFFGIGFFLLNIMLLLQLLPVGRAIMADRYVYIPSIGYCFLIGWYLNDRKYFNSKNVSLAVMIVYVSLLGFLSFNRGKVWASSITLWSDVLDKNSQVPIAWYNRGNVLMESGDYRGAIADYNECINVDEKYWKAYINRGNAKSELKNFIGAIADFDAVIRIDSNIANAYINRAAARKKLNDYPNALADYNKALTLKPDQVELYTSRSNLKVDMQDFQGAIDDLTTALQINPRYVVGYSNRAIIRKSVKDFKGAMEDYDKAIELDPNNGEFFINRANLKFQGDDIKGALADYSESIRLKPDQFLAYKNRGALYLKTEQFDLALADYTAAIKLNAGAGDLYYGLATVKFKKGDKAGTLTDYKKAVELDPLFLADEYRTKLGINSSEIANLLPSQYNEQGKALELKGNIQDAITFYRKAVDQKPDFAEAWFNLGNAYGKTRKFAEALTCMNNAIRSKKDYAEALSSRGIAYASMGRVEDALKDLDLAIQSDPKYAASYYNRAIVNLNRKKKDLACPDLKKAVELGYNPAYQIYQKECLNK